MELQNVGYQNESLLVDSPQDIQISYKFTDKIYHLAYQYFNFSNYVVFIYAFFRVFILPFFINNAESAKIMIIYLSSFFCVSLAQLYDYFLMKQEASKKQTYYHIAQRLNHMKVIYTRHLPQQTANAKYRVLDIFDLTDPGSQQDQSKIKMIALQIKYNVQQSTSFLSIIGRIQFICYQLVHFWGFYLLITYQFQLQAQKSLVMMMIVLGTYQYLQFYLVVTIMIIVMPFFYIKKFYYYINAIYKKYRTLKNLTTFQYKNGLVFEGDRQCHICLMPYENNQNIVKLKCSQLHHYHAQCLKFWIQTKTTCPLCRADIRNL